MRNILIFLFTSLSVINAPCQNCYKLISSDSLKVFIDDKGKIIDSTFSSFYRTFKINSSSFPFEGYVKDFYKDGHLAFEGFFSNGLLNGKAKYYDNSGNLKIDAFYNNGKRSGEWKFYYLDGRLEKHIRFAGEYVMLIDFYSKKGKPLVINGTGKYEGETNIGSNTTKIEINGKYENGLMQDKWIIHYFMQDGYEKYDHGIFVEGHDNLDKEYKDKPVLNLVGLLINENFDIFKFRCYLAKDIISQKAKIEHEIFNKSELKGLLHFENTNIFLPTYKGNDLNSFVDLIKPVINSKLNFPFWSYLSFNISKDGEIVSIQSISSQFNVDSTLNIILKGMEKFSPAFDETRTRYISHLYFPIVKQDTEIFIPNFEIGYGIKFNK